MQLSESNGLKFYNQDVLCVCVRYRGLLKIPVIVSFMEHMQCCY